MRVREHTAWEVGRVVLFLGALALLLWAFDGMMKADQQGLCERDQMECPQ